MPRFRSVQDQKKTTQSHSPEVDYAWDKCHYSITLKTELVTTLKRQATRLIAEIQEHRKPVLITEHGRPAAYLVDVQTFGEQQIRIGILEGIARGERAAQEKRTLTHGQARKRMKRWLA